MADYTHTRRPMTADEEKTAAAPVPTAAPAPKPTFMQRMNPFSKQQKQADAIRNTGRIDRIDRTIEDMQK